MDDAMKWMNNGLAVVLVVGGCIVGWYLLKLAILGCKHLFAQVVIPLKEAGIEHLKQTNTMMRSNEETNRQISSQLQSLNSDVKTIGSDVTEIKKNVSQWNEAAT
jgi:septal ring factor EnvC (AmiA/AmiB activator)